jgi:hypothetical protein
MLENVVRKIVDVLADGGWCAEQIEALDVRTGP